MPPKAHARLGASSAHRWMHCPGSIRLSAGLKDVETIYQLEGRAAHTLAEVALSEAGQRPYALPGGAVVESWQNVVSVRVDTEDGPVAHPVDDVMREAVELFVNTVKEAHHRRGGQLYVERTFDLAPLNPPEPMFGTADAVIVNTQYFPALLASRGTIDIFDLKYGAGVVVDVLDNVQLLYYALGAILAEFIRCVMDPKSAVLLDENKTLLEGATEMFNEVRITIVQPRAPHTDGPVRTSLTYTGADIRDFATKLFERARATQAPDAPLIAGSWCQFCPARGHCPELAAHAKLVAQTDFESVPMEAPPDVEHMPIERVSEMLQSVKVLEIFIRALVERVTRELEAGHEVPGWKMVNKRASRVWNNSEDVELFAEVVLGSKDAAYVRELMSPAQLEKIVGKSGLPDELYSRVSSGLTLVASTDPRPAAAVGPAEDFAQLPNPENV